MRSPTIVLVGFLLEQQRITRLIVRQPGVGLFAMLSGDIEQHPSGPDLDWSRSDEPCAAVLQYEYRPVSEELWEDMIQGRELSAYVISWLALSRLIGVISKEIASGRERSFTSGEFLALLHVSAVPKKSNGTPTSEINITTGTQIRLQDPIHGVIELNEGERSVIDTRYFQRLRRCFGHPTANLVWPSLSYTIFEHALGSMALITRWLTIASGDTKNKQALEALCERPMEEIVHFARLAALLHDLGHLPFRPMKMVTANLAVFTDRIEDIEATQRARLLARSELAGLVTSYLADVATGLSVTDLIDFFSGTHNQFYWLADLLSGPISADQFDYTMRNGFYSGQRHGVDVDRFAYALTVLHSAQRTSGRGVEVRLAERRDNAAEEYIFASFSILTQIYLHRTVRAFQNHWDRFCSAQELDVLSEERFLQIDSYMLLQLARENYSENIDARAYIDRKPFRFAYNSEASLPEADRDDLCSATIDVLRQEAVDAALDTEVFPLWSTSWFPTWSWPITCAINGIRVFSSESVGKVARLLKRTA